MAQLSQMESNARDVLDSVSPDGMSINEHAVRNVFFAMWSASLPLVRIEDISKAIEGHDHGSMLMAANSLVRRGVLRSRMVSGVKMYEINF